ncbi:MAG: RluA family pseudouridine synthase [Blautia sp.]|nr:RluA family pseudouridine synthase [Blautia sp.]
MKELTIGRSEAGQRLDKYLARQLRKAPKGFLYKMLRKKNITLNRKKAAGNEMLAEGDVVQFFLKDETFALFSEDVKSISVPACKESLEVLYEDEDMLLINKPAGVLSQPDASGRPALTDQITAYLLRTGALTEEDLRTFRPGVCNRLDRNTSGIVAAGKTLPGLQELSVLFRDRTVQKYYLCLAEGIIKEPQDRKGYLHKDEKCNKVEIHDAPQEGDVLIETAYRPIADNGKRTLLEVRLLTGKSHQIRAQLAHDGHPLFGDPKYNRDPESHALAVRTGVRFQLLHAYRLVFPEDCGRLSSLSGMEVYAPLPDAFSRVLTEQKLMPANLHNQGDHSNV